MKLFKIFILMSVCSLASNAQNIEVSVTGIRSAEGQFIIRIFKDNASFRAEKPFTTKTFKKSNIAKGEMKFSFTMEPGTYGFAIVDDETNNNEMDFSFFGLPKEGFGFSNYYHSGLMHPHFDSFKFTLSKEQMQKVTVRVRYM